MTEEQALRARAIVTQAKQYEESKQQYDESDLRNLSSEQLDMLSRGQVIDTDDKEKENNGLRR